MMKAIICEQKSAEKVKITPKLLIQANQNGFDNEVGGVTNKCTGTFDVLAGLEEGTEDYMIVNNRIICFQAYQQEIIDSCKGILPKYVPKEWYDWKTVKIKTDEENNILDSEEEVQRKLKLQKLGSFKKPYFFIYNYKHIKSKYDKYIKDSNVNCLIKYGISINELMKKDNLTEDQQEYIKHYKLMIPVSMERSTMNRICWKLEEKVINTFNVKPDLFDKEILKTDTGYNKNNYELIIKLYNEFKDEVSNYMKTTNSNTDKDEIKENRECFMAKFKEKALELCTNEEELCNITVDLCYTGTDSKLFTWVVSGKQIIRNLLNKNNNNITYPILDSTGNIEWLGNTYSLVSNKVILEEEEVC